MDERMHLTPRLRAIMDMVPQGARLADIGTDHALIPAALLRRNRISRAIASDLRRGPLESAERTLRQFGLYDERVSLRLGAGLQTVKPDEADVIVIAGMGGETICEILEADSWAMDGSCLLLMQAMTGRAELRQYLSANGVMIEQERVCREGKRYYTVIAARGGAEKRELPLSECCVSSALLTDELAEEYISTRLAHERKIISALTSASKQKPEELELHRGFERSYLAALEQIGGR